MPDGVTFDLLQHSVTAADAGEYKGGGIVTFLIPWFMMGAANLPLPADLPPYWTLNLGIARYWSRDMILRSTILHEDFWAAAMAKAVTKQAAKSFEVKGRGAARYQEMLLGWGGDGYVPARERGMIDFLTTNNGEFWEIVRVANARGARILGLVHLDSLRCIRTGDPNIPVVFVDLKGAYHALKYYEVMQLVDQPDPSSASLGIGHCACERAYHQIYKLSAIEQYLREKVTGTGANVIDFIQGLSDPQLQNAINSAKLESQSRGTAYYQGHILLGILAQMQIKVESIKLRDLPDGFDREKELEIAQLAYADSIGLDPQEVNPRLMARGALGTGAQSNVLEEKQHSGGTLVTHDKQITHLLNEWILPGSVTFIFSERDLRDEQQKAAVALTRAQTRQVMETTGEITPPQGLQMAVEANDAPREFLQAPIADTGQPLADEEKPIEDEAPIAQPQANQPATMTIPAPNGQRQRPTDAVMKELTREIHLARVELERERA